VIEVPPDPRRRPRKPRRIIRMTKHRISAPVFNGSARTAHVEYTITRS
jgi:hypothetical protein